MFKGTFEAIIDDKVVSKGHNIITDAGRNLMFNWLKNINTNKFIDFTPKSFSTSTSNSYHCSKAENCLFNDESFAEFGSNYEDYFQNTTEEEKKNCSLFCDFEENHNVKELILLYETNYYVSSYTSNSEYYGVQLEISVSEDTAQEAINKNSWKVVKYARTAYQYKSKNEMSIFLGDRNNPEFGIPNVRSIRICAINYYIRLYQLKIVGDKNTYLPPTFIGLGDGDKEPEIKDTELNNKLAVFAVEKENEKENDFSVTFYCHLGIRELVNKKIKEIGLYFLDDEKQYFPYKNQKLTLFSRGLFDEAWNKPKNSIVKIRYTINISE